MPEALLTRRQALGAAGAAATALWLPRPARALLGSAQGGLQPELVTVGRREFAAWWLTDAPADTTVRIAGPRGMREHVLGRRRTVHAAVLHGLEPDTAYRYELRSGGRAMPLSPANPRAVTDFTREWTRTSAQQVWGRQPDYTRGTLASRSFVLRFDGRPGPGAPLPSLFGPV